MSVEASDVSLHRGIHLFTHPTLIYSVINSRQPRFLRRNLSYAGGGTVVPSSRCASALGSALEVRLGDLTMEGVNLPAQVTLVVALCEAATTGRDFKPIRAVAVTLPGRNVGQPAESASAGLASGDTRQGEVGTLLLPLPKRQLTRPMLLIMASDRHPDMKALVPLGGKRRRNLKTGLRAGGALLGLLSELCSVWAVLQPLDDLLYNSNSRSGVSSIRRPAIGEAAPPLQVGTGISGAATAGPAPPPGMRVQAQFQHGRIARSKCSVTANGTTLVATLLNLNLGQALAASNLHLRCQADALRNGVQQQQSSIELIRARLTRTRSREPAALGSTATAGAEAAAEGHTAVGGGQLICGSNGGCFGFGGKADVGCDSGMASVEDEVQVVRLSSLTVSLELGIRQAVGAEPDGEKPKAPLQAIAAANVAGADPMAMEEEECIVEFRYVYDDASWSGAGGAASRKRLLQQQEQLLRTEQQLRQLQQQQERGAVDGANGSQGPGDTPATMAGASGSGPRSDRAVWMKQQMNRARESELEAEAEAAKQKELDQQRTEQARQAKETSQIRTRRWKGGEGRAWQTASATSAPVLERCFVEEMRVPVGVPFNCPLCAVTCRSFQGLQQHLPASHGLYRYTYPEVPEDEGEEEAGPDGAAGGAGGGTDARIGTNGNPVGADKRLPTPAGRVTKQPAQLRKYVVEVRLPAEAVDPARRNLVLSEEDVLLVIQEGRPMWSSLRSWAYSRAGGMVGPVYMDAVGDVAATAASAPGGAPGTDALPSLLLPPGARVGGRTRGGGRGEGPVTPADAEPTAAADEEWRACAHWEHQQADWDDGRGRGSSGQGLSTLVRVPLESIRMSAAGPTLPPLAASEGGAAPVAATAAVGPAAGAAVLPAAFTVGAHPPGRRYFHCRTLMPGVTEEMFGAYDSDDETDDEEWEATFDRHMAHSTRITPLRPSEHRFFKLWSAFARRRPIYADYITRSRCLEFVREHGVLIRSEPELRAALVVHLMLLHEMNLVDPRVIGRCLLLVDGRISSTAEEDERFLATRGLEGVGRSAPAAGGALATVAPTVGAGAAVGGSGGAVVTAAVRDDDGEEQPTARGGEGGSSGSGDDGNGDDGEIEEGGGDGNREEGNADVKERVSRGQSAAPRGRRRRRQADSTTEEPSQRSKRRRRNDEPADTAQEGGPGKDSCPPSIEDAGQPSRTAAMAAATNAAAVEAGAMEAECNAPSPASTGAGNATTAAGNAVAPLRQSLTATGAPECVDAAPALSGPHCEAAQLTRPLGSCHPGQDAQEQQCQSDQQPQQQQQERPAPKGPPTTRATPALSWSLQKRSSRALAPPPGAWMPHQRLLSTLQTRLGIPPASGPSAPLAAGAVQHGGTARTQQHG